MSNSQLKSSMEVEMDKKTPLLEIKNLEVQFKNDAGFSTAIENIHFKLQKGETIGIVGESGSGKSVTALTIMQLITSQGKITQGEIIFNSRKFGKINLIETPEEQMREIRGNEISMIFQEPMTSLNPVFTCGNQVMEAILLHKKTTQEQAYVKTIELFEKVKLPSPEEIFKSYPHQISGGQKQRVMIAMAMICNPSVLIADEPTTALDVTVQATILELMRKLKEEIGSSIFFITHDLGVIAEIADRVIVMYRGKIVEQGTVWEIFTNPKHPYTKGLLACKPKLDFRVQKLPIVSDFMSEDSLGNITAKKAESHFTGETFIKNYITNNEIKLRQRLLQTKKPILEIHNLKNYFPINKGFFRKPTSFVKAVDDVTFNVYPGETLGLVGESGCGKTTLGRTILRLIEPSAGTIAFEGGIINNLKGKALRDFRKNVQIIFQDPYSSLNPRITVGKAIQEPMEVHGILADSRARKARVEELLTLVNLKKEHFNRYPHEFSGGQRQRICIARALALNPKFIICDESVSALDVSVQAQVLNLLNDLKEQFGFTYIFISHDLAVVKFMAARIIVMNKGKIEEQGFSVDIYENPKSEYTRKLIDAIPKGDIEQIRMNKLRQKYHK
jgi:peptide/nickel transport system ATP-binding protein